MGGGRDTTKGIKIQSIICTINSLKHQTWKKVYLEPSNAGDKVDIAWLHHDDTRTVAQVKASENDFVKSTMKTVLNDLIKDEPNAENYILYIVGTCNEDARNFVEGINDKTLRETDIESKYSQLRDHVAKVNIFVKDFDFEALEDTVYKQIHKFYEAKGFQLKSKNVEQKCYALIHKFDTLPILRKDLTREELEGLLMEWIDSAVAEVNTLKEKQERKEKLQKLHQRFYVLRANLPVYFEIVHEKISRLNQIKEFEEAFQDAGLQKRYLRILSKLEEADDFKVVLNAQVEVYGKNGRIPKDYDVITGFVAKFERDIHDLLYNDEVEEFDRYLRILIWSVYAEI